MFTFTFYLFILIPYFILATRIQMYYLLTLKYCCIYLLHHFPSLIFGKHVSYASEIDEIYFLFCCTYCK